ncbi:MAG: EAL domain-containing protein [Solobacterium sp.]|nr:EAL domain-containing protein [Solobacterium sp.]
MKNYVITDEQRAAMEALPQPIAIYQYVDGQIVPLLLSDGFCDLFDYANREDAYRDLTENLYRDLHPDDAARIKEAARRLINGEPYEVIYRSGRASQSGYRIIHAIGKRIKTEDNTIIAHVWYMDEGTYTEKYSSEGIELNAAMRNALYGESVLKANNYDYLTGLPNMNYFFELASAARADFRKNGRDAVLLYMDLVGLKYYNQKYGFAEGDRLLIVFAELLEGIFHKDCCSHFGQGHFAAFMEDQGVEDVLRHLFDEWQKRNGLDSLPVHVGIYQSSYENAPVSTAFDRAVLARDKLKGSYISSYEYYAEEMGEGIAKSHYILEHFDEAIQHGWIQVWYQPIIRAVSGFVCDEEALSRWIDPERGILSPADFIPVLEDAGLIYKLDLYVLEQVLIKIQEQIDGGLVVVPQSVNLSRSDFHSCDIVEEIRKRVDDSGIRREMITIELTESIVGSDFDFMSKQIKRFQDLGFPVWMDDFGSGYSSLDVLQSIKFDLIKFDMSFMRKLEEGDDGKIILTELIKMTKALGVDTVCEGVETLAQVQFLQEIGCSKLQGYYYCKPIPKEEIWNRYQKGIQIGFENPEESRYFDEVGRLNLYDLEMIAADENDSAFQNFFDTLPMGVIEVKDDKTRFVRSNKSYRDFISRYFHMNLSHEGSSFEKYSDTFMNNIVRTCCEQGIRSFYDETMPDGSVVHSFARRIAINPVTGTIAVAVTVLSISEQGEGTTYASIARALAADYYNIYYIDLDTEKFIEYSSPIGGEEIAMERHGEDFFESVKKDALSRIYEEDLPRFLAQFTKENIIRELDEQGVFTITYRLVQTDGPIYANMKITRMPGGNHIILGVSIIDLQMKQQAMYEGIRKERDALARVIALSEDYLMLYSVEINTGSYIEYSSSEVVEQFGIGKEGEDFFLDSRINAEKMICVEDQPEFLRQFTKKNILAQVRENGLFKIHYHLMVNGERKPVSLRIAMVKSGDEERLVAGVRAWKERK